MDYTTSFPSTFSTSSSRTERRSPKVRRSKSCSSIYNLGGLVYWNANFRYSRDPLSLFISWSFVWRFLRMASSIHRFVSRCFQLLFVILAKRTPSDRFIMARKTRYICRGGTETTFQDIKLHYILAAYPNSSQYIY